MEKVSDKHHLIRRSGVWYYSRRVPDQLVADIGRSIIRYSLKTKNKALAVKLREVEDVRWSAEFAKAESDKQSGSCADTSDRSLSPSLSQVQDYVERMDRQAQHRLAQNPPRSSDEKREMQADAEMAIHVLRNPDDIRGAERVLTAAQRMVADHGGGAVDEISASIVRRGLLELDRRRLARLSDDFRPNLFDSLFSAERPRSVDLQELVKQFLELKEDDARINRRNKKHLDRVRASVALISDIVGPMTPISQIDYDRCLSLRSILARVPTNRTKLYGDLPVDQAIGRAEAEGKNTLSTASQEWYLGVLKELLDLALKKRLIASNPAQNLRPLKREELTPGEKRNPFSLVQLQSLFKSQIYADCSASGPYPYRHAPKPWQFWLPLLCLFAGLRPNEACQLTADDVQKTLEGTWFIKVEPTSSNDAIPVKSVKTATSKRRIPVHSQLKKVGFLNFVEDRRQGSPDGARLFPDLKPNKYGNHAWYAVKRFNEVILPTAVQMAPRQSLYSLRHSWRDALRRMDASPATLDALGWSQGKLTSDAYGDKYDPDILVQQIEKVLFPGVDLSHIFVK